MRYSEERQLRHKIATKPNIILILSDDFGYGDAGVYGGGPNRGMPTPSLDRLASEGMTFFTFYAQPSCTPGRAAIQTGRIPNRSGMTTVAFQGQGGGLPAAEWTLASVLKQGGYQTFFTGKWHLGEADYALPNDQGYDEMRYVGLYHLNAYTYGDPNWFPNMGPELRAMFDQVTKGALSGVTRDRLPYRTTKSSSGLGNNLGRKVSTFRCQLGISGASPINSDSSNRGGPSLRKYTDHLGGRIPDVRDWRG